MFWRHGKVATQALKRSFGVFSRMAKKKTKKAAKPAKKVAKPSKAKKTHKLKPIKRSPKMAKMPEVVIPPTVDVTPQVQDQVVEVKPEPASTQAQTSTLTPAEAQEKHEELTAALTTPPEKKGFWARLFGKK